MGLKGDLQEAADLWDRSPWRVRAFLALSVFLASGSIASLSDTVFRWKGFVADAVMLYETYISGQLHRALQFVFTGIDIPAGVANLLILSAVYLGASLRVALYALPASQARSIASRAATNYLGSTFGLLVAMHYAGKAIDEGGAFGVFLGSAAWASFSFWRAGGAARLLWFACLLGPFVLVGLIAAFVTGWSRTV